MGANYSWVFCASQVEAMGNPSCSVIPRNATKSEHWEKFVMIEVFKDWANRNDSWFILIHWVAIMGIDVMKWVWAWNFSVWSCVINSYVHIESPASLHEFEHWGSLDDRKTIEIDVRIKLTIFMQFQSNLAFIDVVDSWNARSIEGMVSIWFVVENFEMKLSIVVAIAKSLAFDF